jgi:hypothetical protein
MKKWVSLGLALFLFAVGLTLSAQTGTEGSILGTVKDSSGAVIPDAQVVVTNVDTGIQWKVATNHSGYFQVLGLQRGYYSVAISHSGFSAWQLERTELQVGQIERLAPLLEVGKTHQEVTITGGGDLVQTEQASVESNIEQKTIQDLPVNGRDPIELVRLTPGMMYTGSSALGDSNSLNHSVEGFGAHEDATQFSVDGISANDPSAETGFAFPNLESVGEFRVATFNFSAENGRQPLQVIMTTRSGTNQFHGSVWDFLRNDAFDATEFFSGDKATLKRNQFGFSFGGPIIRDKTFFFTSFQETIQHSTGLATQATINPAFLKGDFSSLTKKIINPFTKAPFPNNQIPTSMFSSSSVFFFPYIQLPNQPNNRWQYFFPNPIDDGNYVLRLDHNLTQSHQLSLRWIRIGDTQTNYGYSPKVFSTQYAVQHNFGGHYNWIISPTTLFTAVAGFVHTQSDLNSPVVGKENLTAEAGIQGFSSNLLGGAIGLPTVTITGYQGFSYQAQVPASFKREVLDDSTALKLVRNRHTITVGSEYLDNRTLVHHASSDPRGTFAFNNQYTGDGFADYLLGLVSSVRANLPLADFGIAHSPYSGFYAEDEWRALPNLTLNLGFRYDLWWQKSFVRGCGSTFDPAIGKAVAGEKSAGVMDLNCQPVAPFLAAATAGLWVPASQVGFTPGLAQRHGVPTPRIGIAWRPTGSNDFAVRAGYGIFTSSFNGNVTGSAVIGPPYWLSEQESFSKTSNQRWETAFPASPSDFVAPSIAAAVYGLNPMKTQEWNLSIEKALPFLGSAITVSYVGNRGTDLPAFSHVNTAPPGKYTNLQAALPWPQFGNINLYDNLGNSWYHALITQVQRRFTQGFSFDFNNTWGKSTGEYANATAGVIADGGIPFPWMPKGYNRGRTDWDHRDILHLDFIYELPFGKGRRYGSQFHGVEDAVLGGWQVAAIYSYISGDPLTLQCSGATLGNGVNARPNLVGDPHTPSPSANEWFNAAAFSCPAAFTLGTSSVGVLSGPSQQVWDTNLLKNFYITSHEEKYLQFRWQVYNALNHRNLSDPGLTVGTPTFGQILGAGDPRKMELALKFIF